MISLQLYTLCVGILFILAVLTYLILTKLTAPYGRHHTRGFGPNVPNRLGWIIMEFPALACFILVYIHGNNRLLTLPLIFCLMWTFHYSYRTFIFPFMTKTKGKKIPLLIALTGTIFNTFNAFINASWVSHLGSYAINWLLSLPFIIGLSLFIIGFVVHFWSDRILIKLRNNNNL